MDCGKTGKLIRALRLEQGMTQNQLAEELGLCGKTVSKWERGLGCPDVSVLGPLARVLRVGVEDLLRGQLDQWETIGGNMKKTVYYLCPTCGNLLTASREAAIACCGRRLDPLVPAKPDPEHALSVEAVENEWFLTSAHPMTKDHFLTFAALVTGDRLQLVKLYPEWDLQVRFPRRGHGILLWHCSRHGLFSRLL